MLIAAGMDLFHDFQHVQCHFSIGFMILSAIPKSSSHIGQANTPAIDG